MNIITSVLYTIGLVITTVAIGISSLFSGGNFGATIPQSVAIFSTTLATEISSTATSFTLTSGTTADATTLSGFYGFVIDSGTSSEEFVTATCTDTACTGATRGLSVVTGDTTISALKKTHRKGASVKITDHPVLTVISRIINGDESFPNNISIGSTISTGSTAVFGGKATYFNTETIDDAKDLTSKAYVDAVVVSGAPVASTTVKGIVEEATDAELAAGTAAGGTAARLFAGGASHNETPAAGKVPVAASSGMILDGWLGLTTAGDMCYSDGTDFGRLPIGTTNYYLYSTGSAPAWGGANLNEANTFFGATDISGAEAETLTGFATEASTFWASTDISAAEAEDLTDGGVSAAHSHAVLGWKNGTITRDVSAADGAVTTAHGLGRTPIFVRITGLMAGEDSVGVYNGTTTSCVWSYGDANDGNDDSNIIHYSDGTNSATATIGVDATNITLTWTKANSPTGTFHILWEAY
uniref:Uncharacterized protein n=2 Tax=viral metagenome TaxID=1070528 RepID=A0A6M3X915_9ZZZZ